MTSKHPCVLPLVPCPYRSLPHSLFPPQFDLPFSWADLRGEKGAPKSVAVVEAAGLLLRAQGLLEEWAVRVSRISHVAAHQMQSKKLASQMVIGQQQMEYWLHLSSHRQTRSQALAM